MLIRIRPAARNTAASPAADREEAAVRNETVDSFLQALAGRVPAPNADASPPPTARSSTRAT
jgi:hypothetical protein